MTDNETVNRTSPPVLYSTTKVAEILGVSTRTIWNWIHAGDLSHIRLGPDQRLIRVRHEDLETFLEKRYYSGGGA